LTAIGFGALCLSGGIAVAGGYLQTDLVSDIPGLATVTDSNLKNPWGVSFLPGSPIWVSNQGTNTSTLYPVVGSTGVSKSPFVVNIPPTGGPGPTGQVANSKMSGFDVLHGGDGKPAAFIFANLNGSISAWDGSPSLSSAFTQVTTPGAVYTGLAINQANTMLYAANDSAGKIDVFDNTFKPIDPGAFATPAAIASKGLVPFNVEDIGGNVWVTYALAGHGPQTTAKLGQGAVAEFSEAGVLESMNVGGDGKFASPWGLTVAPSTFGKFGGDILVGNFSYLHSEINAFNPTTWAFEGSIAVDPGAGEKPGGLWSLFFGMGGADGNPNVLYFTDGINGESGGLFGAMTAVPEPSTWAMMLLGLGALALLAARRRAALATV
jgi:uncharacterized protein (TIGR03118 family)